MTTPPVERRRPGQRGTRYQSQQDGERVWQLYCDGYTPTRIAILLGRDRRTIYRHIERKHRELAEDREHHDDLLDALAACRALKLEAWSWIYQYRALWEEAQRTCPDQHRYQLLKQFNDTSRSVCYLLQTIAKTEDRAARLLGLYRKGRTGGISAAGEDERWKEMVAILNTPVEVNFLTAPVS